MIDDINGSKNFKTLKIFKIIREKHTSKKTLKIHLIYTLI